MNNELKETFRDVLKEELQPFRQRLDQLESNTRTIETQTVAIAEIKKVIVDIPTMKQAITEIKEAIVEIPTMKQAIAEIKEAIVEIPTMKQAIAEIKETIADIPAMKQTITEIPAIKEAIADIPAMKQAIFETLEETKHIKSAVGDLADGQERQDKILESLALRSLEQETDIKDLKRIK